MGDDQIPRDRAKNRLLVYLDDRVGTNAKADVKTLVTHASDFADG